ncbi:TPA: GNAT family N-acetyltransferase [Candidatus Poribacteria bacterium]|nr:GNAT family N-acetyltransferase [Candidatus Poribacteria bacterium]
MEVSIKAMEKSDVKAVVDGWNRSLIYDQVNEKRFQDIILGDPNYEKNSCLVAAIDNEIVGFISVIAREGISGADNRGTVYQKDYGYIKGLFVSDQFVGKGIASRLLDKGFEYLKSKDKSIVKVLEYTGRYFFPGVDTRYERALKFFESKGFVRKNTINDVDLEIENFEPNDYHKNAIVRAGKIGVNVVDYDPSMLDKMRSFVEKLDEGLRKSWFPKGWEEWFQNNRGKVVALKDNEIVGWASFGVSDDIGWFGPTAVISDMRGNGIGSWLLLESVMHMKNGGAKRVIAGWANTPFYIANGWKICRQYIVFEKKIIE